MSNQPFVLTEAQRLDPSAESTADATSRAGFSIYGSRGVFLGFVVVSSMVGYAGYRSGSLGRGLPILLGPRFF